jgi:hypothetical protein
MSASQHNGRTLSLSSGDDRLQRGGAGEHEADFRGIKRLRELLGPRFHGGIVLYDGDHVLPLENGALRSR